MGLGLLVVLGSGFRVMEFQVFCVGFQSSGFISLRVSVANTLQDLRS